MERDGLIDYWDDTRIQAGEKWNDQIDAALDSATVAVLFISQDFINSKFIYKEEIPRILARQQRDDLTVLPVFLSHSTVDETEFPFIDTQGQERRAKLSQFQGIGTPDKPLSDMTWSDRDRLYKQLNRRIRDLAQSPTLAVTPTARPQRASFSSAPPLSASPSEATHEYPLTIHLEPQGNTQHAHYVLPSGVIMDGERDWQEGRTELETLQTLLNDADNPVPVTRDVQEHYGAVLFEALFGSDAEWEPILRNLFNQPEPAPRPNPIRAPVRLRICTDDALLLGMPWRLTSWNHYPLVQHGWEFATTQVLRPTDTYTTTAPCNVLLVAPQTQVDGAPLDPMHPQAIIDVLQQVWPTGQEAGYVRTVRTRQELENALRGMRPHLIYVYGHGVI